MMPTRRPAQPNSWIFTMIALILVVGILWAAKVVLIPLALAVLLTFLLTPLCNRVERWGAGRVISVIIVTTITFAFLGAIAWTVAGQIIDLAGQLSFYQDNIREKLQSLRLPAGGPLERATESIRELTQGILESQSEEPRPAENVDQPPVPVEVVQVRRSPYQQVMAAISPLMAPLASAGIVIVFVIFMLLQRNDLRDRVIRLIGRGRLTVATQAIDDAASRVSRFLLMQLVVNASYGFAVGVGLFIIGLPNAMLWGVLATLVRFIPYAGPWIGSLLPISFSMAVFDGWTSVMWVAGLFVVIELISNNVMEPLLYGHRTGVSPVAILMSAVFWAWLWGPVGLVLATPLTVCVVVMGRYIPRMEFLNVLLSDQPGLSPASRVYQRLLAMDLDDAVDICETFLTNKSLLELYEEVLLPALVLAEHDRHHDQIESDREDAVFQGFRYLVEDLGERYKPTDPSPTETDDAAEALPPTDAKATRPLHVLCVPARDFADEIAATILSQVLNAEGMRAEVLEAGHTVSAKIDDVEAIRPDVVCISAIPPQAQVRTRTLCRRINRRWPDLKLAIGYWSSSDLSTIRSRVGPCQPERVVSSLADAINVLRA